MPSLLTKTEKTETVGEGTAVTNLWIVGAGGLLAGELLRLVRDHPALRLAGAVTRQGGERIGALHPHLGAGDLDLETTTLPRATEAIARALAETETGERTCLVLALPHASGAQVWKELRATLGSAAERLLVVDLSADHRLRDPDEYARWYGEPHPDPAEPARFVYGLPEHARERVAAATRVAAPGCFATALQLATLPAARASLVDGEEPWVLTAVTGSSGSGAKPLAGTHHPHRHGNLWAYARDGHRHEAELLQALEPLSLAPRLVFVPHSGPFVRGIHLTAVLPLRRRVSSGEATAIYRAAYRHEPFVRVLADEAPDLRRVVGSNSAALGLSVRDDRLVVLATLDNLIKGGAGQALQCLNLMLGLPEETSLPRVGLGVV